MVTVPEGHEAGLVPNRRRLVAHHVSHRQSHRLSSRRKQPAAPHHLVHPCTPPLLRGPAVWVLQDVSMRSLVVRNVCKSHTWAAGYYTWLLVDLTPPGVVFSFLFYVGPTAAESSSQQYAVEYSKACQWPQAVGMQDSKQLQAASGLHTISQCL